MKIINGATGSLMTEFYAYASTFTGGVYVTAGDMTGDGKAELAVGSGIGRGEVKIFNSAGTQVRDYPIDDPRALQQGVRVGMADTDGDGKEDLLLAVGTDVQVRNPLTNATKETMTPFDPTVLGGVFVG